MKIGRIALTICSVMVFTGLLIMPVVDVAYGAPYDIKWGTAPAGGMWQVLGTAMLEDLLKANSNIKGSTVPVGGAANVVGVSEGKLNVAFSFTDVTNDAVEGREFFKKKISNIRQIGCLFPEPTQFAVWADSNIKSISDLKGRRVTPGPKGSAVEVVTKRILQAYNISYKDLQSQMLGFEDGSQQMIDGHIDAILYGAMIYPAPTLINANSQRQIRLLPLSNEVVEKLVKTYKGLEPYTLPAKSYKGVDYPVLGVASTVNVIVRDDMPEEIAYSIAKTIAENFERYKGIVKAMALGNIKDMPKEIGIPFHPGAIKYYKERGWIKK